METENLKHRFLDFLRNKFDLSEDKAQEEEVVSNVKKSVEFKGTNLWVLIFATVIASIGLNLNSTAVIIGAMLISPLMGPIMGCGLAIGINDFELLKRSLRNFGFAVLIGLIVSWLYFSLTPLPIAQSELLARTQPTTWDVLIAFFGGLAGIVAQSRKDRTSTVIPGVAIATALMPPLCTAGFGLATFQFDYFFGAFYLFFINTVFISLATYIIVRFMNYQKKVDTDPNRERKIRRIMGSIALVTLVPSVLLGFNIVNETLFYANTKKYIESTFVFKDTQVIDYKGHYKRGDKKIEVMLVGKPLSPDAIEGLQTQLTQYNLHETTLTIKQQSLNDTLYNNMGKTMRSLDQLHTLSNSLIQEKESRIKVLQDSISIFRSTALPTSEIVKELSAISGLKNVEVALSKLPVYNSEGKSTEMIVICYIKLGRETGELSEENRLKIIEWMKVRTGSKQVELIIE